MDAPTIFQACMNAVEEPLFSQFIHSCVVQASTTSFIDLFWVNPICGCWFIPKESQNKWQLQKQHMNYSLAKLNKITFERNFSTTSLQIFTRVNSVARLSENTFNCFKNAEWISIWGYNPFVKPYLKKYC